MKFTPTDQIEARFQKAQTQVDQLVPNMLGSPANSSPKTPPTNQWLDF